MRVRERERRMSVNMYTSGSIIMHLQDVYAEVSRGHARDPPTHPLCGVSDFLTFKRVGALALVYITTNHANWMWPSPEPVDMTCHLWWG